MSLPEENEAIEHIKKQTSLLTDLISSIIEAYHNRNIKDLENAAQVTLNGQLFKIDDFTAGQLFAMTTLCYALVEKIEKNPIYSTHPSLN